ncbi:glycosyltransferase [Sphingomonas sp. OK281]|uniref:glycosyltransferase n=1 Tax=Sphingomonas sp. OK281 TaxID=1881067 RepID=UPI0008F1EF29|nr:glycosyltransferase [Sphingomonas sp. OK281]SFO00868.1 UDP:flavonoid glycosyltransferase YjiC, YdhE family [Sphingomonas sp. OK281]
MARIVLATIGSLGDLHPFIAIGRSLAARGERVLLAVPEDHMAKVKAAGLEAAPILPSFASICARLGLSDAEVAAKVLADRDFVIDEILMPSLRASTAALDAVADGADALAGSTFAFSAAIVAEKRRLPLATIILQPMTLFSAWQPPVARQFELMRHRPQTRLGYGWNSAVLSLARTILRRRHARRIDAVRAEHGLGPGEGAPLLDHGPATAAILCCWSSALGALPPDVPSMAALTGFPFFDSETGADDGQPAQLPELDSFLDECRQANDPPLIFTLGSFAVASAGRFYENAAAISWDLGKRALLLTGRPQPPHRDGNCLFLQYAPHSAVFPEAAVVIHHGGIGTTGQALRAGRPQIVVPHFGDQFDNAARLVSAGIALTVKRERFGDGRTVRVLAQVLSDRAMAQAAQHAADVVAGEDGAASAAERIVRLCS